jgi:signal transduction histidine kinase
MSRFPGIRPLWGFGLVLALALGTVLGVNLLMEAGETQAALEDFQQDQLRLAEAAASLVQARLDAAPDTPVPAVSRDLRALERPGTVRVFLRPPGRAWLSPSGQTVVASLLEPAPAGSRVFLVERAQAPALGLPPRMAAVGMASCVDARGGAWSVAVAGTASRERDRARNARWRLLASAVSTGGFLLVIIGLALRYQKKDLELAREIELRELRRHKDQELNRANRTATMLTLASGVAHEIATPLGIISGRTAMLSSRVKDDERSFRLVQTIQDEMERINRIVRRFLDLARGGKPAAEDLNPAQLIQSTLALVEHRFEKAGVRLVLEAGPELPKLLGDVRLLEHMLVNLLLNACDASAPGDRVTLGASLEPGGLVMVVADQGTGIPEELAGRVMEPFFTTKPRGQGSGLGLAIVQEIVRMHQGQLHFEHNQPRGTRVRVWLPAA